MKYMGLQTLKKVHRTLPADSSAPEKNGAFYALEKHQGGERHPTKIVIPSATHQRRCIALRVLFEQRFQPRSLQPSSCIRLIRFKNPLSAHLTN
jgi:hypothetical protein